MTRTLPGIADDCCGQSSGTPREIVPPPSIAIKVRLTPKQRQVLTLVMYGYSNKEIAAMLSIAETTVKAHASSVLTALNCVNRVEAAVLAFAAFNRLDTSWFLRRQRLLTQDEAANLMQAFDDAVL